MQKTDGAIAHVCVVLPTYNEAANIKTTLARIFGEASKHPALRTSVLVVDDDSPDKTYEQVLLYQWENPNVYLLHRKERQGLGRAYIHGFRHAMDILDPDVIVEMDADGQHNPADIFALVRALEHGADFAIGSRYISGGHVSAHWGMHRRITSACASTITRAMLGLGDIRDCSGGFRAIRTRLLARIDLEKLPVKGYAFQAVLLEEALFQGAIVTEVPITFHDRMVGTSKMRFSDFIEGGTVCIRVRAKRMLARSHETQRKRHAVLLASK